jgi:very-short-patch-repair endonuclease
VKTEKTSLARSLRRDARQPEKTLWLHLKNRKLAGCKFRRQQPFGPYVLDFYCAKKKLNIELDGGQHDMPDRKEHDAIRSAYLERYRVRTIRFWNSQVRGNLEGVLERIRMEVEAPSPLPSPARGEGVR